MKRKTEIANDEQRAYGVAAAAARKKIDVTMKRQFCVAVKNRKIENILREVALMFSCRRGNQPTTISTRETIFCRTFAGKLIASIA